MAQAPPSRRRAPPQRHPPAPARARAYAFRAARDAPAPPPLSPPPGPLALSRGSQRVRTGSCGIRDARVPHPSHLPTLLLLFAVRHSSFSSPSVSPSFSLLREPASPTGGRRRIPRAPSVQCACACARPSGPRAPSSSRSSITWLARGRRRRSRRAGSSVEGARELWRLVTGRSRSRLWPAPSRSRSLSHTYSASRPGPRPRLFSRPGPLRVALRVSARRGRPGGALALRVRADGRRAGCGAWCPRSWAACPAR